jgi:hypothetical protein
VLLNVALMWAIATVTFRRVRFFFVVCFATARTLLSGPECLVRSVPPAAATEAGNDHYRRSLTPFFPATDLR